MSGGRTFGMPAITCPSSTRLVDLRITPLTPLPFTDTGANASAEEAEEGVEDADVKVNNIVNSFRLQSTQFDKKGYLVYLKGYMKAVKAALQERGAPEEEISAFEKGASKYVKEKLLPNFKDFEFYTGESMNPDGLYVPCPPFGLHDSTLTPL